MAQLDTHAYATSTPATSSSKLEPTILNKIRAIFKFSRWRDATMYHREQDNANSAGMYPRRCPGGRVAEAEGGDICRTGVGDRADYCRCITGDRRQSHSDGEGWRLEGGALSYRPRPGSSHPAAGAAVDGRLHACSLRRHRPIDAPGAEPISGNDVGGVAGRRLRTKNFLADIGDHQARCRLGNPTEREASGSPWRSHLAKRSLARSTVKQAHRLQNVRSPERLR